jgi:hypothetical protein
VVRTRKSARRAADKLFQDEIVDVISRQAATGELGLGEPGKLGV